MSERSVAEIIGWVAGAPGDWGPHRPTGCSGGDFGEPCECYPGPTPDDMLSWLRHHIHHDIWNTDHVVMIAATDSGVDVQWYSEEGISGVAGPSLHDALEAAVRAVAVAD